MKKNEIIGYIKSKKYAEIADLQKSFGVSYRRAKEVVDELVSQGNLVYTDGVRYEYTGNRDMLGFGQRRGDDGGTVFPRFTFGDEDEDELRRAALDLGIRNGRISAVTIHNEFATGYLRACRVIDWLISCGYAERESGSQFCKVLMTREEFESKYKSADDDLDELFDENDDEQLEMARQLADMFREDGDGKDAPISSCEVPEHNLWRDGDEFAKAVMDRMERLIKSDMKMGRDGAVKRAEACLDAVRDTCDKRMVQVYERMVYELKNTSPYLYAQLKKQFRED